ncbi:MAG: serine/threonine protein kinase [Myxococcota bacterium]|nr:serine/threonine protein kinase [Myxococcota bacterium]
MIGETLGHYRILSTIGKGGMGVVYLAEHTLIGRQAAVKLLLPEMTRDAELVDRFFNEARAAAKARHQGLVEVFDFGYADDGSAYIVMEVLSGESLAARLERQKRFATELALSITRQVASALQAAHEQGVVHRDLKPENIHLIPDPSAPAGTRIKVLDFGIAKLTRDEVRNSVKTRTGVVIGTPRYMSPEQCKSASNVDARTDIYALGCIFYEMLVGKPPFEYDNWGELVAAHIHEAAPPPRTRVPEISADVDHIVMRAIAKDPVKRYQSMTDLSQAIDLLWPAANSLVFTPIPGSLKTITDETTVASPAPTIRTRSPQRRFMSFVIGAVVLGGVTAVVVAQRIKDEPDQVASTVVAFDAPLAPDAALDAVQAAAMDAAPAKVRIAIDSVPRGARVSTVEGVGLGVTPLERDFNRIDGQLEVVLRLAGFKDTTLKLATTADAKQLVTLQKVKPVSTVRRGSSEGSSGPTMLDPYGDRK